MRTQGACRVIAAIDDNHNGDPDLAWRLVDAAREAGADGIKIEKRTVPIAAVRSVLDRPAPRYKALGPTYRKALERTDVPVETLATLCRHADGLEGWLAPHDLEAYRTLEPLPFTAWKVEAPLATHVPLLTAIGASRRPAMVEVAGCTEAEVQEVLKLLPEDVTLIHSVFGEGTATGAFDVAALAALRRLSRPVGYRDSTLDPGPALVAVAFGAVVVEKRLTLNRGLVGPYHATSLLPNELGELVRRVRELEAVLGADWIPDPSPAEMDELEWRRVSIVAARPIARGTTITPDMLTLKPPFRGLSPRLLHFLVGRRALYDIPEDEYVTFGMVEL